MCPFFRMDENYNCECKADDKIKLSFPEIDKEAHEDCPLKNASIKVEYAGEMNVIRPTAFLFHAKKPNFGFGDHIPFNAENYEIVAEIYKKDVTPDWIFEHTNNIDVAWTEKKWSKKEKIVANFTELRSTSVGDVIVISNRIAPGKHLVIRCEDVGWKPVDESEYCCSGCHEPVFGDNWPTMRPYFTIGCDCE
jgi:hypothetical protein